MTQSPTSIETKAPATPASTRASDAFVSESAQSPADDLAGRTAQSLRELPDEPMTRLPDLLEAMVSVGTDLNLHNALDRIARTAATLTEARYAAVGILTEDGSELSDLITYGISDEERATIGRLPDGHSGVIGALLRGSASIRIPDVADDPRSIGLPPGHPPVGAFLGVPIQVDGEVFGNLYLASKIDETEFTAEDLHLVRVLATEAGIAMDNARLHSAAQQRQRWIDGAASLTTALLAAPGVRSTTENALTVVAQKGRELADSSTGVVFLPHPSGGLEVAAVATDLDTEGHSAAFRTVIPQISPTVDQVMSGQPLFSDDLAGDPRAIVATSRSYGPTMVLPLSSNGRVLGALALSRMSGEKVFTEVERTLATQFAAQAALALVMADAQRDRERLAVFEDRDRIARDLHDLVIQRLFATGMMLESAQRKEIVPEVREGVGKAVDELDVTIQEIRTAIIALQQGPSEAPSGLRTRVLQEIGAATSALGARPSVHFVGPVDSRMNDQSADALVETLRRALEAEAREPTSAARIEVAVDATANLEDGTPVARLTLSRKGEGLRVLWEGRV